MQLKLLYENVEPISVTMLTIINPDYFKDIIGHKAGKYAYSDSQLNIIVKQSPQTLYDGLIKTLSTALPCFYDNEKSEFDLGNNWEESKFKLDVNDYLRDIKVYKKPYVRGGTIFCWFTAVVDNLETLDDYCGLVFDSSVDDMLKDNTLYLRALTTKDPDEKLKKKNPEWFKE